MSRRPNLEERFWPKVDKSGDCWLWTAGDDGRGYGKVSVNGRNTKAHRVSYEMAHGPIPEGMHIDHLCHTPLCVNPEHLRAVTAKQNNENRAGANHNNRTSGIRGVAWDKVNKKWAGRVAHNGINYGAGRYLRIEDAEAAVVALRLKLHTHNSLDRAA